MISTVKITVQLDDTLTEPELLVRTPKLTGEIQQLLQRISIPSQSFLVGFRENGIEMIEPKNLIRFYATDKKVMAQTVSGEFLVRLRLYELEERFVGHPDLPFVRISHSEIVNLKAVSKMDLSLGGTIVMTLINQQTTYVSRRYVAQIKQTLGI